MMVKGHCIEMEGFLSKKSRFVKKWRLRWCVLTGDSIFSFKNERKYDENPTETISVANILSVTVPEDEQKDESITDQWTFSVEMENKTVFTLSARSQSVRTQWMDSINKLLALNRE